MHACERLQLCGGETVADEPRGWATTPNFRVASRGLGCLPPPPPGPAPEAETGDEVTRGGGGCEINTSGWTSSPNFRVACRLLEHGAASRGNMAGLPLFETDAMGERERHPNLGSLRSDSRSSFFASYRSIAAFLDEARALSLEQTDAAGRHLPQQLCDTCRLRRPPTTKIQFP